MHCIIWNSIIEIYIIGKVINASWLAPLTDCFYWLKVTARLNNMNTPDVK